MKILRRYIFIVALMASALFTHAQCIRVHYDDGWTEQIDVNKVDSITFHQNSQHFQMASAA